MVYSVVLPLHIYCGLEAATSFCARSRPPLICFSPYSDAPWFQSAHNGNPLSQQTHRSSSASAKELRQHTREGDFQPPPPSCRKRRLARGRTLRSEQRPRLERDNLAAVHRQPGDSSLFSTSPSSDKTTPIESSPVTFATPSQATYELMRKWHRNVSSSATQRDRLKQIQTTHYTAGELELSQHLEGNTKPTAEDLSERFTSSVSSSSGPTECPPPTDRDTSHLDNPTTDINALMRHPALFENIRAPRYPIVLCHGLYGFDVRGPFLGLEIHYWAAALEILRNKIGAEVIIRGVPGTGSIPARAKSLHEYLSSDAADVKGAKLNFVGHSMGGLDARYLISHLKPKPEEYIPVSVTTISTPHRGSPFMDWCNANVGIGNEYVEEAIREYEEKQGCMEGGARMRNDEKSDEIGSEQLPYSLKTPLLVRPKKNGKTDSDKAKDAEVSNKAAQELKEAEKADTETGKKSKSPTSSDSTHHSVQKQLIDAVETVADKLTPDDVKGNLSSSKIKSLTSLGFVSPLTRALSSFGGLFSSYILSVFDQPAYAMLSTRYMAKVFNPSTPDSPDVSYFSIAARIPKMPLWHPLWLPKVILDAAAESRTAGAERDGSAAALGKPDLQGNDGLVSISSAKWGQYLGVVEDKDHWDLRGSGAPRWGVSGKINPATGKPFKSQVADGKQATLEDKALQEGGRQPPSKASNKEKSEDGWLMINRMLGNLLGSKTSSGDAKGQQQSQVAKQDKTSRETSVVGTSVKPTEPKGSPSLTSDAQESAKAFLDNYVSLSTLDEDAPGIPRSNKKSPTKASSDGDSGLVNEVASWISDRLPQGSEERRKLADEATRMQRTVDTENDSRPSSSVSTGSSTVAATATAASSSASPMSNETIGSRNEMEEQGGAEARPGPGGSTRRVVEIASTPFESESEKRQLESKKHVSRDEVMGRSQGDIGSGNGAPTSTQTQTQTPTQVQTEEEKRKKKERSEKEELERFWIALCQHLYAHGF